MHANAKPIPEGYHTITPYLTVRNAAQALEFYKQAFGAEERFRLTDGGRIGHAEIRIGNSLLMLSDEYPEMGVRSPESVGGTPVMLHLYVEDVDAWVARAVQAGGRRERTVENQFYGDRTGIVIDPFGHKWWIATHIEDVPPEEMEQRVKAAVD